MNFVKNAFHRLLSDIKQNKTALCCILLYVLVTQLLFHSVCPIAIVFGFPCPACGLTRAGLLLLLGQWSPAFDMNPAIFVLIPYLLYLGFCRYALDQKPPHLTPVSLFVGCVTLGVYFFRLITGTLPPLLTDVLFPLK